MNRRMALIAVTLMMLAILSVWAQQGAPPQGPPAGSGQGEHRPKPPLEQVLDANADGKLTSDEYRPPRPPRADDQGSGH